MSAGSPSIRATLRHLPFRALVSAGLLYFIGNAMQAMAAAWLMVEVSGSSFLAALVQTAVFLPMFLLVLPAGVLADTHDRRRLMMSALAVQAGVLVLMALLFLLGGAGPGVLLVLTFAAGCAAAMLSPPWNSAIVDTVPRDELPQAITVVSISYNGARAVGPALAGVVYAFGGAGTVFAASVLGVVALALAVRAHPPRPHPPSRLPAERLWGGMLSALRFARHSETLLAQLVRVGAYSAAGSALWALLPVIGQRQLGLGSAGFGLLMGCLGTGAVLIGLQIGRLRTRFGLEAIVGAGGVVFAIAMAVSALSHSRPLTYGVLMAAGASWMAVMSTYNTATQTSVPPWVRARATSLHTLAALGAFALGSAFWGALSDLIGLAPALGVATAAMLAVLGLARPFPLRMGALPEVTQVGIAENLLVAHEPDPEAGPVAVEIRYPVRPEAAETFLDDVTALRGPRKRDGATFWRVYRDLSDPALFVERFIVASWADYLHQRARATLADQALEAALLPHLQPGAAPQLSHFIAER
ncbi:MAG: MFS transporter [Rubrivivax sp.]|nr:MFS transporter [Rubrivivax sp.]